MPADRSARRAAEDHLKIQRGLNPTLATALVGRRIGQAILAHADTVEVGTAAVADAINNLAAAAREVGHEISLMERRRHRHQAS